MNFNVKMFKKPSNCVTSTSVALLFQSKVSSCSVVLHPAVRPKLWLGGPTLAGGRLAFTRAATLLPLIMVALHLHIGGPVTEIVVIHFKLKVEGATRTDVTNEPKYTYARRMQSRFLDRRFQSKQLRSLLFRLPCTNFSAKIFITTQSHAAPMQINVQMVS